MNALVAAALLLSPELAADGALRLVSQGTGDEPVQWLLDGHVVATTNDTTVARIDAVAGQHALWATTGFNGDWRVLARLEPTGSDVMHVPAWTAQHEAPPVATERPDWLLPVAFAAVGAALVLVRSKNP